MTFMRVELNTNCAPLQHLVDMGYVEASVLAESQTRYQVDLVGPVPPDVSWQAKDAERFDHSRFTINWEAQRMCCPASLTCTMYSECSPSAHPAAK